jgi:hypothetical protein
MKWLPAALTCLFCLAAPGLHACGIGDSEPDYVLAVRDHRQLSPGLSLQVSAATGLGLGEEREQLFSETVKVAPDQTVVVQTRRYEVAGKSLDELRKLIWKDQPDPDKVTVAVAVESVPCKDQKNLVNVAGAVNFPARLCWHEGMDLATVFRHVGGFSKDAAVRKVAVIRHGKAIHVDFTEKENWTFQLQKGDKVIVDQYWC